MQAAAIEHSDVVVEPDHDEVDLADQCVSWLTIRQLAPSRNRHPSHLVSQVTHSLAGRSLSQKCYEPLVKYAGQ